MKMEAVIPNSTFQSTVPRKETNMPEADQFTAP